VARLIAGATGDWLLDHIPRAEKMVGKLSVDLIAPVEQGADAGSINIHVITSY
jgi:hypothetical protein